MFAQVQIYPPGQEGYCHMAITIPYKLDRKKKQIAEIIHIGEVKPPYCRPTGNIRENRRDDSCEVGTYLNQCYNFQSNCVRARNICF